MGCVETSNHLIIGKSKTEDNNLFRLETSKHNNYLNSKKLSSNKENININYVNHFEALINKMPQIINKYNIIEQISNNDMSTDYKLQLKDNLNKYKTLKILRKKLLGNENKIETEIKLLNSLNHEKLLKIEDCFFDSINYYLIIEYCNSNLTELIDKKKIVSENQVKYIIFQLLEVISYLNSKSLIHTDIKPDNILIFSTYYHNNEEFYNIKLLNFGSSTFMEKQNNVENLNYPLYVSPEIFDNNYNIKNDIWSIGVVMYELLFGFIPFYGENYDKVVYTIKKAPINFIHDSISDESLNLLKNMLIRNPTYRYNATECLYHSWFKNIDDLLVEDNITSNDINKNNKKENNFKIKISEYNEEKEKNEFNKINNIINDFNLLQVSPPRSIKLSSKRNLNNIEKYHKKNLMYQSFKYIHHYLRKKYYLMEEMEYLKDLFDKNKINDEINFEKTIFCFKKYCGYNNNLINDLILDDIITDKLKVEFTGNKINLIQFQNFLIKEKENDINEKLWKPFSNLEPNNKLEIEKCFEEIKPNYKFLIYFEEMKKQMNEEKLKENYLFYEYKTLIEKAVDNIENEKKKLMLKNK